jgi:hypothetical protein
VEADRAAGAVPAPAAPNRPIVSDVRKEVIAVKKIVVRKLETIKTTRPVMYDPCLCPVA